MPLSISFHAPEGGHRFQTFESPKAERHRYTHSADRGPSADEIGEGGDRDADRAAQAIGDHVDAVDAAARGGVDTARRRLVYSVAELASAVDEQSPDADGTEDRSMRKE